MLKMVNANDVKSFSTSSASPSSPNPLEMHDLSDPYPSVTYDLSSASTVSVVKQAPPMDQLALSENGRRRHRGDMFHDADTRENMKTPSTDPQTRVEMGHHVVKDTKAPASHESEDQRDSIIVNTKGGSYIQQLGVTILRVLLLMRRGWFSTFCEMLIPILFVIGTVILWMLFGRTSSSATESYIAGSDANFKTAMDMIESGLCLNASATPLPIGGYSPCSSSSSELTCFSDEQIPTGLCYVTGSVGPAALLAMNALRNGTTVVPSLDEIIKLQWILGGNSGRPMHGPATALAMFGKLLFAPDTESTKGLVEHLRTESKLFTYIYGDTFASVKEAEDYVRVSEQNRRKLWAIVQVNEISPTTCDVSIRVNSTTLPSSRIVQRGYVGGLTEDNLKYLFSGFLTLQTAVSKYYLKTTGGTDLDAVSLRYTAMPTAAYETEIFLNIGSKMAPLIIVLAFLYPVSQMTKRIVIEKEMRIREAMLIMGLSEVIMYLSWFLIYMAQYLIVTVVISLIIHFTYMPKNSFGYIFFLFLFFAYSTIALSALIASFFSKARLAALLSPLIYFLLSIPLFAIQGAGAGVTTALMILSPTGLAVGMSLLFDYEMAGGASSADLNNQLDVPNLLVVFVFLIADTVLYLLLMTYFELVIPKDWGTTKHPLFFILDPIKWLRGRCCKNEHEDDEESLTDGRAEDGVFEPISGADTAAVQLKGLRKTFKRGGSTFVAVNNLYWTLKEGEISVLLGHNGAGKSTAINLMTGMLEADGGDCLIYGKSIRTQQRMARREIGFCPQHNILWPELTCREHLEYFAAIKGLSGDEKEKAVQLMLAAVDLNDKEHYLSKALSGGQKRKLSVAVAFVGGSRLIFLDEPTAGMDVGARRHTWELLKKMASAHTILLTTHFMDEADLLGNTVGIMSHGRLQCSGSNMFLKSELGVGFILTMSVAAHVEREPITQLVQEHVPDAEAVGTGAGEMAYRLPMSAKKAFPQLLSAIEEIGQRSLGVSAYSLSVTTMEEIFLEVAKAEKKGTGEVVVPSAASVGSVAESVWNVEMVEGTGSLMWLQFRAMMIKRFWNALRDRRTQFFQILCPVLCVLLAMLLTLINFMAISPVRLSSTEYKADVEVPYANCDAYLDPSLPPSANVKPAIWTDTASGQEFSDKLMKTYNSHKLIRPNGYSCTGASTVDLFYNVSSSHSAAIGTADFFSAVLRKSGTDATMVMHNDPLPRTKRQEATKDAVYSMILAIIIMVPFTLIPSTFVGWIVKERECKARHLQNVSGLSFWIYWLSNFLFDMASYLITMFLVIIIFAIFQRTEYVGKQSIGATIVLFLLYGLSGILMAYVLSFFFSQHSTAQNVVMLANFIVGFLLVLAVSSLSQVESTKKVANVLKYFFRIIPCYCVGEGINNLATLALIQGFGAKVDPWAMNSVGWPCLYMALEIPVFLFITLFVDHPGRRQRSQRLLHNPDGPAEVIESEDPDVVEERRAVMESDTRDSDLVSVRQLRKIYSNGKVAVRNITFGVKPGEVFGFLGTNGAGKTTTISILCQEFYPTNGHASICGHDIVESSQKALQCIGYCPQFDACLDLLTVEEHLYLYAGVRGISPAACERAVEGLMKLCELCNYRSTKSHELSGGNRRKLSVAIALLGGPRVVFLDEPSAGMDPVARRGLWTAIETIADNCSVVLTTHHLEEVEALAHRVAIMVDGTLRCIGDKTHLKSKYGSGYEVNVRIPDDDSELLHQIKAFFAEEFPDSQLTEVRSGRLTYDLPSTTKLSNVFTLLEENRDRLGVTDYTVSQTSIERVFLRISAEAEAAEEAAHAERHRLMDDAEGKCCPLFCR